MIALIWAEANGGVIGNNGGQPFMVPEDLVRFRQLTTGHPVIMGRHTWLALPESARPLPDRVNIVMTRHAGFKADGAHTVSTLGQALAAATDSHLPGPSWVIGGGAMYRLFEPLAGQAKVTVVDLDVEGDTLAPELVAPWRRVSSNPEEGWHVSKNGLRYRFDTWRRGGSD
ncbi:MAG: dihydrofolate reductase [Bifidobacteriaceae bacterium]|jgi:dihydrofolate reductase|nr:dihydrofolate reductase [Bifidobacteriaceae bacterium]